MKQQLQSRLQSLKSEQAAGLQLLTELEAKHTDTQNTLLRIQGAIQILEEELAKAAEQEDPGLNFQTNAHTESSSSETAIVTPSSNGFIPAEVS
ncbi:MAG: hypothetical protein AAFQ63_13890 [Cyanobacteria bacterium J06621_11]